MPDLHITSCFLPHQFLILPSALSHDHCSAVPIVYPSRFSIPKAYAVLKRALSFVQTGAAPNQQAMSEVVVALGAIINSAWIDADSTKKVQAFLEETDSLSLHQPQAQTSNYQSKSGGILDAIQGMQEKNAEVGFCRGGGGECCAGEKKLHLWRRGGLRLWRCRGGGAGSPSGTTRWGVGFTEDLRKIVDIPRLHDTVDVNSTSVWWSPYLP